MKPLSFITSMIALMLTNMSAHAQAMEAVLSPIPNMLPDGIVTQGSNDIHAAWLSDPTTRYAHGVLGDGIEAAALRVELEDGTQLTLTLPETDVFEDRYPRLVDLDRDGRDEMVLVKSTQSQGAALVIAGVRDGALKILAEAKPIGQPQRWLNPVGVGDFDADGEMEIAYVETPHIGGTLRIVRWQGNALVEVYAEPGFSNHAIGTRELQLSVVLDADGDGVTDLVVPNTLRNVLRVVTFKDGTFKQLFPIDLGAPMVRLLSDYAFMRALVAVLSDGTTAAVRFK